MRSFGNFIRAGIVSVPDADFQRKARLAPHYELM
jgi:hypothetical protein